MASQFMSNPILFKLALQFYAIKKTLTNYGKPTVSKDERGQHNVEGEDTDEAVFALALFAVYIVAAVGLLSGGVTMYFYTSYLLDFASLCLAITAPLVAYQKYKLQGLGDLRGQHNKLREKVNVLASENNKLTKTIDEMENQMGRLNEVEQGLSKIADKSGTQVQRLVELVKENGELQKEVKQTLEKQVEHQLIDIVVKSDRDGNFVLAPQETEMLKVRLKSMDGVKFNSANFDKMIASDENELTVTDMMNIIRNLLDDEVPDEENIFVIDPESLTKRDGIRSLLPF